jgi:hypothetical protein
MALSRQLTTHAQCSQLGSETAAGAQAIAGAGGGTALCMTCTKCCAGEHILPVKLPGRAPVRVPLQCGACVRRADFMVPQSGRPSSAEARSRPAETSGRLLPPPSNWLKRETPFICDVRFTNNLPEVGGLQAGHNLASRRAASQGKFVFGAQSSQPRKLGACRASSQHIGIGISASAALFHPVSRLVHPTINLHYSQRV